MVASVREYVKRLRLPPGYKFVLWNDTSVEVRGRLDLLISNVSWAVPGVCHPLFLFLDIACYFCFDGHPISIFGAGIALACG